VDPKTVDAAAVGVKVMLDGVADKSTPLKVAVVPATVNVSGPDPMNDQDTREADVMLQELQLRTMSPFIDSETIE
jgi:hypothetical protein